MKGVRATWNDGRGLGFVAPAVGGPDVFVHVSAFIGQGARPAVGDTIGYELELSPQGKPRAARAEILAAASPRPRAPERVLPPRLTPSPRASRLGYLA